MASTPDALGIPYWDASDLSTLFQDAGGTIPCTGPNQPVGLWKSKGITGLDMRQATASARPTLKQGTSGLWWVEPDGVDDFLSDDGGALSAYSADVGALSVFHAGRRLTAQNNAGLFAFTPGFSSTSYRFGMALASNRPQLLTRRLDADTQVQTNSSFTLAQNANFLISAEADYIGRTRRVYAFGELVVDAANVGESGRTSPTPSVRAGIWSPAGGSVRMQNRHYCIAAANRILTASEAADLRAWINDRIEVDGPIAARVAAALPALTGKATATALARGSIAAKLPSGRAAGSGTAIAGARAEARLPLLTGAAKAVALSSSAIAAGLSPIAGAGTATATAAALVAAQLPALIASGTLSSNFRPRGRVATAAGSRITTSGNSGRIN